MTPAVDRFRWHPEARLFGPEGEVLPLAEGRAVLPDTPAGAVLAEAMARGVGFRIGAVDEPAPGERWFETLTSGSLGRPRRIRRSPRSWLEGFAVNAGLFDIGPGVGVAVLGGLAQSLSLYGAVEGLCLGARVHLLGGVRPDRQGAMLAGVQALYATPAQLRLLVEAGALLGGLRHIVVGGSKLDSGLRAGLARIAPSARVAEFYGAAEASFISLADGATPDDSVGRPYPGVEIELRGEGEIWVRSPYLFDGYGAGEGSARWRDGWLSVGEYGRMADGFLYLSGRAGRMVTVADQNVFPEEIEGFLAALPGVRQAAVLPQGDALRGTVLVALLQGDRAAEAAVLAAARAELGPLKAPRRVIWVQDWPMLPSGKTDLRALEVLV